MAFYLELLRLLRRFVFTLHLCRRMPCPGGSMKNNDLLPRVQFLNVMIPNLFVGLSLSPNLLLENTA